MTKNNGGSPFIYAKPKRLLVPAKTALSFIFSACSYAKYHDVMVAANKFPYSEPWFFNIIHELTPIVDHFLKLGFNVIRSQATGKRKVIYDFSWEHSRNAKWGSGVVWDYDLHKPIFILHTHLREAKSSTNMEIVNATKVFKALKEIDLKIKTVIKDSHTSTFEQAVLPCYPNASEIVCMGHMAQNIKKQIEKIKKGLGAGARRYYMDICARFNDNITQWKKAMTVPSSHYRNIHTRCRQLGTHPKKWRPRSYRLNNLQLAKIDTVFKSVAAKPRQNCHTMKTSLDESFFHKKAKWASKYSHHPKTYPFWVNLAMLDEIYGPKWIQIVENAYLFQKK